MSIFTHIPSFGISSETWENPRAQAIRDELIDRELALSDHPSSPTNAARAGWYAALKFVNQQHPPRRNDRDPRYVWVGSGLEPKSWYAPDGTKVYRDYTSYVMD